MRLLREQLVSETAYPREIYASRAHLGLTGNCDRGRHRGSGAGLFRVGFSLAEISPIHMSYPTELSSPTAGERSSSYDLTVAPPRSIHFTDKDLGEHVTTMRLL